MHSQIFQFGTHKIPLPLHTLRQPPYETSGISGQNTNNIINMLLKHVFKSWSLWLHITVTESFDSKIVLLRLSHYKYILTVSSFRYLHSGSGRSVDHARVLVMQGSGRYMCAYYKLLQRRPSVVILINVLRWQLFRWVITVNVVWLGRCTSRI